MKIKNLIVTLMFTLSLIILQLGMPSVEATVKNFSGDRYRNIDKISSLLNITFIALSVIILILFFIAIRQYIKKIREKAVVSINRIGVVILSLVLLGGLIFSIYLIPHGFLNNITWSDIKHQYPKSFILCFYLISVLMGLYTLYFIFTYLFPLKNKKSHFALIIMSLISGGSYAFITSLINTSLAPGRNINLYLAYYFFVALLLYVSTLKFVRMRVTIDTNNYVNDKRIEITDKILRTPYYKVEEMGKENIYTCVNNDTETVSSSISMAVSGMTSLVIIVCCLVYLALSNSRILLISLLVISIIFVIIFIISRSLNSLWEKCRDNQNVFYKQIDDLLEGFKELKLSKRKRQEFNIDLHDSCNEYKKSRTDAELVSANLSVAHELLVFSFLALLIFLLPLVSNLFKISDIRGFIIIFILLKGHFDMVLGMIPRISQIKVSVKRIEEVVNQVSNLEFEQKNTVVNHANKVNLKLENIEYNYKNKDKDVNNFKVGPINCEFFSGEITFIAGGNGSGKSTLVKILTGLYNNDKGKILLNNEEVSAEDLGGYFSAIFSDYHLFGKLYGISHNEKSGEIEKYMRILKIDDKLSIGEDKFSTIKLSTGQKKRMALLISYLENNPIYLFDEWAADQDPEFKEYFYLTLLPQIRDEGKCIIAVTHDDSYFNVANKVIKMENGKIINVQINDSNLGEIVSD